MVATTSLTLNKQELLEIAKQNQFDKKEKCIIQTYEALRPFIRPVIYYDILERNDILDYIDQKQYVIAAATLGQYVDELQDLYQRSGEYLYSYAVDCISMKLLEKSYQYLEEKIARTNQKWIQSYCFLGDQYPLEKIADMIHWLKPDAITYNEAFALSPKKTAVYIGILGDKRKEDCNICENCQNTTCIKRKKERDKLEYSYGYQRIFKK